MKNFLKSFSSKRSSDSSATGTLSHEDSIPIPPPAATLSTMQPLQVVELFQSQGCSSCPPANSNIINLSSKPSYLVLTYHVTYWDQLGWTDTFGDSSFDKRQRDYCNALQLRGPFTPQVIVNGKASGVGNTVDELDNILRQGYTKHFALAVQVEENTVTLHGPQDQQALIYLVKYNPRNVEVYIQNGENGRKTLPHINVVQEVTLLGTFGGSHQEISIAGLKKDAETESVIIIQAKNGGAIIGAAKCS